MEWYDDLSDETINRLKQLCYVYEDLDTKTQQILCSIPLDDLWFRDMYGRWGVVQSVEGDGGLCRGLTYRLRLGWQRPEKKTQGNWEECEIKIRHIGSEGGWYFFQCRKGTFDLVNAFSMVGFGGIQFEGDNPSYYYGFGDCYSGDRQKPATPKRVRFWVEG